MRMVSLYLQVNEYKYGKIFTILGTTYNKNLELKPPVVLNHSHYGAVPFPIVYPLLYQYYLSFVLVDFDFEHHLLKPLYT